MSVRNVMTVMNDSDTNTNPIQENSKLTDTESPPHLPGHYFHIFSRPSRSRNSLVTPSMGREARERLPLFLDGALCAGAGPSEGLPLPAEVLAEGVALYSGVLAKAGGALLAEVMAEEGVAMPAEPITGEGVELLAGVLENAGGALAGEVLPEAGVVISSDVLAEVALTSSCDP